MEKKSLNVRESIFDEPEGIGGVKDQQAEGQDQKGWRLTD
jgi:hypothetical protein